MQMNISLSPHVIANILRSIKPNCEHMHMYMNEHYIHMLLVYNISYSPK
jgi:hypothetical protein